MIKNINKVKITAEDIKTCVASSDEQETTITISRSGDIVSIWSNDNTMLTKFKRCLQAGDEWECYAGPNDKDGKPTGYFLYTVKKNITFRCKKRAKRNLSTEQKEKLANRLRESRKKQ